MSTQPNTDERGIGRRTFMRGVGATAVAGVGLASSSGSASALLGIGNDEDGYTSFRQQGYSYLVNSVEDVLIGDSMDGLENYVGKEAVIDEQYSRLVTHAGSRLRLINEFKSNIENSKNVAWSEVELKAAERMNEGDTEEEVLEECLDEVDDYYLTVESNLLDDWEERVNSIQYAYDTFQEHEEWEDDSDWQFHLMGIRHRVPQSGNNAMAPTPALEFPTETVELVDGSTRDVPTVEINGSAISPTEIIENDWGPNEVAVRPSDAPEWEEYPDDRDEGANQERVTLLKSSPWQYGEDQGQPVYPELYGDLHDAHDDMVNNVVSWVPEVYEEYQSGDIDTEEVISARTFAAELSAEEEGGYAYAMSDLVALGIETDVGGEMVVHLEDTDATVTGLIGMQDSPSDGLQVGETYDPDDMEGPVYLSYDPSVTDMVLPVDNYEGGLDGGVFTLEVAPGEGSMYRVQTSDNETGEVVYDDFTAYDDNSEEVDYAHNAEYWEVDLSDQLANPITEVEQVRVVAADGDNRQGMTTIEEPFTVQEYTDGDGQEQDSAEFQSYNQSEGDVNLSQEQFEELLEARDGFDERDDGSSGLLPGWGDGIDSDVAGLGAVVGGVAVVGGGFFVLKTIADIYLPG